MSQPKRKRGKHSNFGGSNMDISHSSGDASLEDNDVFTSSPSSFTPMSSKRSRNEPSPDSEPDSETDSETDSGTDSGTESGIDSDLTTTSLDTPPPLPVSEEFPFKINLPPVGRPVRVYCDGIYDLFHFGHAKSLEQAKKAFPDVYLLVGVCDDETTHKKKGMTVLDEKERAESVRHCKWVDEVIEHAPWVIDEEFLAQHKIDYVAHDNVPYPSGEHLDVYGLVKSLGKFLPVNRTEGISTSDLITRIVRDYDIFLRRNLERGVSRKDLNIGFLKNQEINMKKSLSDIRTCIHQNWQDTAEELKHTFVMWEERSHEFVRGFTGLFGADAVVKKLFGRRN